ncbi:hypothetical protein U1Q18_027440 [Sarracenia purpurea var. burkii]
MSMVQEDDKRLKYLDFVQAAAIYVIVCFSTLYEYAKENSGPLKPGVQTVQGTVKAVFRCLKLVLVFSLQSFQAMQLYM